MAGASCGDLPPAVGGCPRLEADGSRWPGVTRRAGPARRSSRATRTTSCSACSTRRTRTPSPAHPWTTPSRSGALICPRLCLQPSAFSLCLSHPSICVTAGPCCCGLAFETCLRPCVGSGICIYDASAAPPALLGTLYDRYMRNASTQHLSCRLTFTLMSTLTPTL